MIQEDMWLKWMDEISESDYVVIDQFLSEELLAELNLFFDNIIEEDKLLKSAVGSLNDKKIIPEIRGDYTYWINRETDLKLEQFFLLSDEMVRMFNRYCFLSLSGSEFHFAQYPPGAFYRKHLDQFKNRNNRMITFILYLNKEWNQGDGGELVIYRSSAKVKIEPLLNRAVFFKSEGVPHEVLTTNIHRRSLTGWLLYQPPVIGQILA